MRKNNTLFSVLLVVCPLSLGLAGALAACSANGDGHTFEPGDGGGGSAQSSTSSTGSSMGMGGDISFDAGNQGGAGGGIIECDPKGPDDDVDLDSFTENEGDCNDCDKNRNPNAVEVPTDPGKEAFDENCDGNIDEAPPAACDDGLAIDSQDPLDAAKAINLCKMSTGPSDWGVVSAAWSLPDGSPPPVGSEVNFHLGHGILTGFGPNVTMRHGASMLALSSGTARQPTDPDYQSVGGFSKGYQGNHPPGFPKESPACPGTFSGEPNDPTGVDIIIRTPSNAYGFSFDFNFYTYEWPNYICSTFNDFFIALLSPQPAGQNDENVSFDSQGNPVSVNNALLGVCGCPGNPPAPCIAGGKTFQCPLGNLDLIGTGFGFDSDPSMQDHGSTGWLQTKAPANPASEIRIRYQVYDSGDGVLDTSTLIDNWKWIAKPGTTVGTIPIPH